MAVTRAEALAELTGAGAFFEVAEADVRGARLRTFTNAPMSLRELLVASAAYGDRDHLVYGDQRLTFAEHFGLAAGLALRLCEHYGVGKGDRVAIGMRNYPEWAIAFWAVQAAGAVAVPLNAWWVGHELGYALEDSGATVALVDGERFGRLDGHLPDRVRTVIVTRPEQPLPDHVEDWVDMVAELDRSGRLPDVGIDPDDDATMLYTSGTTGFPKGAVATHRNHATNYMHMILRGALASVMATGQWVPSAAAPCALQTFPFFHVGGLTGLCVNVGLGGRIVLQYKWNLEEALAVIEREQVTSLTVVPTILREILSSPLLAGSDLSSLSGITSGGAPVPPDLVQAVDATFGVRVTLANTYGLTETSSAVTVNEGAEYVERPESVGRLLPLNDIRVVDPDTGDDVATGQVGELWFRGPTVVRGYWRKPDATEAAFVDGWFRSGDLGYVDEDGFVYVADRLKDVIIRGGENVYSAEVEARLLEHPAVSDVAVVGLPHAGLGEEVAAVVRVAPGASVTEEELRRHAAARLAHFKVPAHVFLRTEPLPRTATGKVLKRRLRDELVGA